MQLDRNGHTSAAQEPPLTPDDLNQVMHCIDLLAKWVGIEGVSEAAIAQWKLTALASMFPSLSKIIESAKDLVGSTQPVPEVGMSVTELAQSCTEICQRKIKPVEVNDALAELGWQVYKEKERVWELTETGLEYGQSFLATSKVNSWQGPRVKWFQLVIPLLADYFNSTNAQGRVEAKSTSLRSPRSSKKEKAFSASLEFWFIPERIKHLGHKVTANHLLHIEMEAAAAYKERHNSLPTNQLYKTNLAPVYSVADLDILDNAISVVIARMKN